MTIRQKLYLFAATALLVLSALAAVSLYGAWQAKKQQHELVEFDVQSLLALQAIDRDLLEIRFRMAGVVLDQLPSVGAQNHLNEARAAVDKNWRMYLSLNEGRPEIEEEIREVVAKLTGGMDILPALFDRIRDLYGANDNAALRLLLEEEWPTVITMVQRPLGQLLGFQRDGLNQQVKDSNAAAELRIAMLLAISLIAVALLVVSTPWIIRSITRPIAEAVKIARTVAEGDLTSHIHVSGKGETAELLGALRAMNDSLVKIVGEVRQASDSIATGSAEISTGNADLSHRTEMQAANLEETAASTDELTATVRQNAETSRQASEIALVASESAARGGQVVGQVVTTMQEITASSQKIADITSVIDGIAFQTNILALNAAVEAARAGEQGRGFAVVAGEVRTLAQRSAAAAKEIKALITTSVGKVQAGSVLVGQAGESVGDIVTQVRRVTELIGEITASSQEQASGIGQVGDAVQQLDQVTQQNAALVQECAGTADNLKHQAARLSELVSVFKLAEGVAPQRVVAATAEAAAASMVAAASPRAAAPQRPARAAIPAPKRAIPAPALRG